MMFGYDRPSLPPYRRVSDAGSTRVRRERGSLIVAAAVALLVAVILLGAVQWAYVVYARRDMQKGADLAALTGAQVMLNGSASDCTAAMAAATTNVGQNLTGLMAVPASGVSVLCGRWDPNLYAATARHFSSTPAAGVRENAVEVTLSKTVPSLVPFLSSSTVTANSVASLPGTPVAAFSIADTLVGTSGTTNLLGQLLQGVGLNLTSLDLVGYDGLANATITPSGLLNALGIPVSADATVGDLNTLLAANNVSLGDVLNATLTAAGQQSLLGLNTTLLSAIEAQLGVNSLSLALGSTTAAAGGGLFAEISAATAQSALNAQVSALGVLATAISVATAGHAATVNLSSPSCLLGLLCVEVAAQAVEPAQIGIGGVGTQAYTAQIRTYVHIYTDTASTNPLLAILGTTNILKLMIDIPIAIDLNSAQATLEALCDTQDDEGRDLATIAVSGEVAKACVGNIATTSVFSSTFSCSDDLGSQQLMSLTLLGTPLASVTVNPISIDALPEIGSGTFYAGESEQIPADGNQLAIGTTVDNILNALFAGILDGTLSGSSSSTVSTATADQAWDSTATNACMSGLSSINATTLNAWNCRSTRRAAAISTLSSQMSGLGGYVGTLVGSEGVIGILNSALTLNIGGVLTDLGNVLGTVGNLLGSVLTGILGNPADQCTPTTLLGIPLLSGTDAGCEADIVTALAGTTTSGSTQVPNALLGLLSFVYQALQPILSGLNDLGSFVATLLQSLLGLQIGQNTVTLLSIDCNGKGVQIVY